MIDDNLARQYWPNENPIGRHMRNGSRAPWATIQCFDAALNTMREPEEIANDVLAAIEGVLSSASSGEER